MHSFATERKLFLIAALAFLFEFVLGSIVALRLNLSDPGVGGSVRDHWMTNATPITDPLVFMVPYIVFLVLALAFGLSWIPDHGMVQQGLDQHLNPWTGVTVALLMLATPAMVVLGIRAVRRSHLLLRVEIPLPK